MNINKETIEKTLTSMMDVFEQEEINLFKSILEENNINEIKNIDDFYFGLLYPYNKFINGLIKSTISKDYNVRFLLKNSQYFEHHFRYWIEKIEGIMCCADKTRTILRSIFNYYTDNKKIKFDYEGEYTYHLPKFIFTEHQDIIDFFDAIKHLYYGNPEKYLIEIKKLTEKYNEYCET